MTDDEALALLTYAALLDPRMKRTDPVEAADRAQAWAAVLHDVSLAAARTAVDEHYRTSREPLMPADILDLADIVREPASPYRNITAELASGPLRLDAGDTHP